MQFALPLVTFFPKQAEANMMRFLVDNKPWLDWLSAIIQAWGVVVLVLYTYYTRKALRQNRAWLNLKIEGIAKRGSVISVRIKNVGRMPATRVHVAARALIEYPSDAIIQGLTPVPFQPIGVDDSAVIPLDLELLPSDQQVLFGQRGQDLHIVALIDYDDGFGEHRRMRFGWQLNYLPGDVQLWVIIPGIHDIE